MKKQTLLLGTLGAVAAIGAGAATRVIPVQATSERSTGVQVSVNVIVNNNSVAISGVSDNQVFTTANIGTITTSYSNATKLIYTLVHRDAAGRETTVAQWSKDVLKDGQPSSGVDSFNLNLKDYPDTDYGRYTLKVEDEGGGVAEDALVFRYAPIANPTSAGVDAGGNPIVEIEADDIDYVIITLEKDDEVKYTFKVPAVDGKVTINLKEIAEANGIEIDDDDYLVRVIPYNSEGVRLGVESIVYNVDFENAILVPDTGITDKLIEKGLSDTDIIAVCCVLFAAAIVGGLIALTKTRRHNRR